MSEVQGGLKAVAVFEAFKGVLALLVGLGLHQLAGDNISQQLELLMRHAHLNPAGHYPSLLLEKTVAITSSNLILVAVGAVCYAIIRFIEAYGLWLGLLWTEWFALLSGMLYLPFEVYELIKHPGLLSVLTLTVNVAIVAYMFSLLGLGRREQASAGVDSP